MGSEPSLAERPLAGPEIARGPPRDRTLSLIAGRQRPNTNNNLISDNEVTVFKSLVLPFILPSIPLPADDAIRVIMARPLLQQDERGVQYLFKDLKNPKLETRYKASIDIRNAVNLAHRGKQRSTDLL